MSDLIVVTEDVSSLIVVTQTGALTISESTGTVYGVSVVSANGFAGSVAKGTTTPQITLSATITGMVKADGTKLSAATAGTDFVLPGGALGTPSSGTLTNCTFPVLNQNSTGTAAGLSATLAVSSGGTGLATLTADNVILGNGTSSPTFVAPSDSGNVLTSNGTTWQSVAPAGGGAGVSSLTAGTGISLDVTTGDITVTNSEPDQTVTLTDGAGIAVTGTYPSFTIDCSITQYADTDARLALSAGTSISYDNTTGIITNSDPDQTVTLTDGTGITITGTYPSFTIDCDITQYTDTDARLAHSAGTGISYDNTTGIITNDNPDQTVTLTDGAGITITGTYPSFTVDCDITQYADADARLALSAGTGISYDNTTGIITNDNPDQTVTLTDGADITITGTYPSFTIAYSGTPSSGTVTTASVVSANGFAGTVATDTTTPAITITTTVTGILIGDGTAIAAATAGTDYVVPSGSITGSAASLSATLDVTSGGTGQITATAAFNALAPDQTSNSGKYLKTDGTNTSWGTLPSSLPVLLFGGVTTRSVSVANGSLPVLLFGGVTTVNVTVT